jgi:signal transduction histidine kinase
MCEIIYQTDREEKRFRVGVLHFFNYRDAVYILGKNIDKSVEEDKVVYINLAMHRIKDAKVIKDETFQYPDDFDAKSFFDSDIFCFDEDKETIKLKFVPGVRDYIMEREWFPNQEVEQLTDGSVILTFESDVNMILTGWIRGFGPDVEVLEPKELRQQMIENLFANAVTHVRAGVTITVGDVAQVFFVVDDGPGIPPEHRDEVFHPGFTTATNGTGFGLMIVTRVAEAHGWDIRLADNPKGGARFEITGVEIVEA